MSKALNSFLKISGKIIHNKQIVMVGKEFVFGFEVETTESKHVDFMPKPEVISVCIYGKTREYLQGIEKQIDESESITLEGFLLIHNRTVTLCFKEEDMITYKSEDINPDAYKSYTSHHLNGTVYTKPTINIEDGYNKLHFYVRVASDHPLIFENIYSVLVLTELPEKTMIDEIKIGSKISLSGNLSIHELINSSSSDCPYLTTVSTKEEIVTY